MTYSEHHKYNNYELEWRKRDERAQRDRQRKQRDNLSLPYEDSFKRYPYESSKVDKRWERIAQVWNDAHEAGWDVDEIAEALYYAIREILNEEN